MAAAHTRSALLAVLVGLVAWLPGAAYGIGDAERRAALLPPPNPVDFAPAWSADGKRVVYGSYRLGLGSVSVDGRDERSIVGDYSAALSPNGEWVAFRGSGALSVRRVDGTETRLLARDGVPVWSPDSQRIAVSTSVDGLWVVDRDGDDLVQLAPNSASAPSWSPDGEWIAFEFRRDGNPSAAPELMVVNSSGGVPRALPGGRAPRWSPDGALIAFLAGSRVHVVRPDGSGRLAFPDAIGTSYTSFEPVFAWMPDSRRIVFGSSNGLELLDVSSGAVAPLHPRGQSPSPSPDGSRIAFVAPTFSNRRGIHVVGVDGLGFRRLTNHGLLVGTSGPDELRAAWWHDVVRGLGGDDRLLGGTWNLAQLQSLYGGAGDDLLVGSGADRLDGGPGDDNLRGHKGEDRLVGGPGRDYLFGGRGRDRFFARDGERDVVICGRTSAPPGADRVWADHLDFVSRDCEIVHRTRR